MIPLILVTLYFTSAHCIYSLVIVIHFKKTIVRDKDIVVVLLTISVWFILVGPVLALVLRTLYFIEPLECKTIVIIVDRSNLNLL